MEFCDTTIYKLFKSKAFTVESEFSKIGHCPVIRKSLSLFLEDNVKYLGAKAHHLCDLLLNCRTAAKTVMFVIRERKRGSDADREAPSYPVAGLRERYATYETIIFLCFLVFFQNHKLKSNGVYS